METVSRAAPGVKWSFGPERLGILFFLLILPTFVAIAAWRMGIIPRLSDAIVLGVLYKVTGLLGITAGFHRYATHGSYQPKPWLRFILLFCGQMAVQGPVFRWALTHDLHHRKADTPEDPHSTRNYQTDSWWGELKNLAYAHIGWAIIGPDLRARLDKLAENMAKIRDEEKRERFLYLYKFSKLFPLCILVSYGLPTLIGALVELNTGDNSKIAYGAFQGFVWGGVVRIFLVHNVTWSVNSICHVWGERPFKKVGADRSGDVKFLAPATGGESLHARHHHNKAICLLDWRWWMDTTGHLIMLWCAWGWATNPVLPREEDLPAAARA